MSDSIKKRLIARLLLNLQPLAANGPFREILRKADSFVEAKVTPSLHLVAGPELPASVEEDNRGYTLQFPVELKITTANYRDAAGEIDDLTAAVQQTLEADWQLGGLANSLRYQGDQPFIVDLIKPLGGTVLFYQVQYRRLRADPTQTY